MTLLPHEPRPEHALSLVLIVRAAAEPHPLYGCPSPSRHRIDMIELEESPRLTAVARRTDEGALALVPLPDGTPDLRRDVAVAGGRSPPGRNPLPRVLARSGCGECSRFGGGQLRPPASAGPDLSFLEVNDQGIECPVEHLSDIPRRNGMAEQVLGVAELVPRALPDRELEKETLGRSGDLRVRIANMPQGMCGVDAAASRESVTINMPRGMLM